VGRGITPSAGERQNIPDNPCREGGVIPADIFETQQL